LKFTAQLLLKNSMGHGHPAVHRSTVVIAPGAATPGHQITGTALTSTTLGGHPKFPLDFLERAARLGVLDERFVVHTAAYAHNHGHPPKDWIEI
jgi:hypothetical protein